MGNIVGKHTCSKSNTSPNSGMTDYFEDFDDDSCDTHQKQLLKKQLIDYMKHLTERKHQLSELDKSFLLVLQSSIINILGKKQCESYQNYGSFNGTDLKIMRSICKVAHFDVDKYYEINHLIQPLKLAFKAGSLQKVLATIESMKQHNDHQGLLLSTIDYKLLDILEYFTKICVNKEKNSKDVFGHWMNIFDILFRGTNVKLSNRRSRFSKQPPHSEKVSINKQKNGRLDRFNAATNDTILFQCLCHNSLSQQEPVEISACSISYKVDEDTEEQFAEKEAIFQNNSILINKAILDKLKEDYPDIDESTMKDVYPLGIHLSEFDGYVYSIRPYKGVYVASQVCENILFIPRTTEEFEIFLYKSRVLEMLCNFKRHYISVAKIIRQASVSKNVWSTTP
ncbi:hypothetical protein FB192DRAFT_1453505 [Mucor lusitanicus]|uniref:Uncharacterized protein n=1 Tax=Mucor circinelloides f. lusitanicus TaxID=29924 RepID=A0A8H4BQU6_MUCCL|nr:hypothetical protein FB192DRAFT_1453505 [Mucor lusitanicus]